MIVPEGWDVPEGWTLVSLSVCAGCRRSIGWALTPKGRNAPIDRDGTNHFATCEQAAAFRRSRTAPVAAPAPDLWTETEERFAAGDR